MSQIIFISVSGLRNLPFLHKTELLPARFCLKNKGSKAKNKNPWLHNFTVAEEINNK